MLRNYLKAAARNLLLHKAHALVNIPGLVVGLAACLLIFLVLQYEDSFDNFHPDKDRIFRVVRVGKEADPGYRTGVPFPVPEGLRSAYPQLQKVAAIYGDDGVHVTVPEAGNPTGKKFKEVHGFFTEPSFFDMFHFPFLAGSPSVLNEVNTVVLNRTLADKYFGDWKTAVGRTIHLYNEDMKVSGVLEDPPLNTDFPLSVVVSYATLKKWTDMKDWVSINDSYCCFVSLRPGESAPHVESMMPAFIARNIPPDHAGYNFLLQPLSELHRDPRYGNFNGVTFSRDLTRALALIGIFLLVVASVNFINLSTAQAVTRAKEVGVRKVLGGTRQELLVQFLGETSLTCLIALFLAVGLAALALPALSDLLQVHLSLHIAPLLIFGGVIFIAITLLSGFYPALVLSGFKPVQVLKSGLSLPSTRGISLRKVLVVFQLVIAQALIIGTLVVVSQMNYIKNAYLGFNKTAVVTAGFERDSLRGTKLDLLRSLLLQQPSIQAVSLGTASPARAGGWATDMQLASNHTQKADLVVNVLFADTSFFHLYDMHLVAGRIYFPSDTAREFIVNEALLKQAGLGSPRHALGTMIRVNGLLCPIVGVLRDFHAHSLRDPIDPMVISTQKPAYSTASVRIQPGQAKAALASMASIWSRLYPDRMFEYDFLDQTIAAEYQQEDQVSKLYQVFSGIAIFISCLGLYGLISFMAVRRNKEIGVRKVLGASVGSIVYLLSREFTLLILIAFAIAGPVAWYFTHGWLDQYAYRISFNAGFFGMAILCSVVVAWITIGYSAIRAARTNPIRSLRAE